MRICNLIPSYQVLSYISICFPNSDIYLQGFTEVLQGVALYAFLMLLCDYMAPDDTSKVKFFSSLETKRQWQPKKKRNGLAFLSVSLLFTGYDIITIADRLSDSKLTWYSVLHYPVITWITAVTQVVTQSLHVYCLESNAPHFAHVWVCTMLKSLIASPNGRLLTSLDRSDYLAVNLSSPQRHHPILHEHERIHDRAQATAQADGFQIDRWIDLSREGMHLPIPSQTPNKQKYLTITQILFLILTGTKVLRYPASMTYIDTLMGLPTMLICLQMVPLSFLVLHAYRTKPYEIPNSVRGLRPQAYQALESDGNEETLLSGIPKHYQGGPWGLRAWTIYLNPLVLFQDVHSAYLMIHNARALQKVQEREEQEQEEMTRYETRYDPGERRWGAWLGNSRSWFRAACGKCSRLGERVVVMGWCDRQVRWQ